MSASGSVNESIWAKECYDFSKAKPTDIQKFCPLEIESGEYAWINESIQDTKDKTVTET
jgi:hypothetical protein